MDIWVVSKLLVTVNSATVDIHVRGFEYLFSILWSIYLQELMDHAVNIFEDPLNSSAAAQ